MLMLFLYSKGFPLCLKLLLLLLQHLSQLRVLLHQSLQQLSQLSPHHCSNLDLLVKIKKFCYQYRYLLTWGVLIALLLCHSNNLKLTLVHKTECLLLLRLMPIMPWVLQRWVLFQNWDFNKYITLVFVIVFAFYFCTLIWSQFMPMGLNPSKHTYGRHMCLLVSVPLGWSVQFALCIKT